jgi:uncharacterized hydrophobic protein (TIGR00271 family)
VLQLRVSTTRELAPAVVARLEGHPAVSSLAVLPGASVLPPGDVVLADIPREAANEIVDSLREIRVQDEGTIQLQPVDSWLSRSGYEAERRTPGSSADSVVWSQVTQRAYEDSELNWTYLSFMTLATTIAAIAIVIDSQILVIGAMVLGPEFVPIAALGLALVRRRRRLFRRALVTLAAGFLVAIVLVMLAALVGRALGWITYEQVTGPRPDTEFIYSPDRWSFLVALVAAAAGVLSLTSAKTGGLSGVFISVTTVPASGNIALGLAFGAWHEVAGSAEQLALNVVAMALAGWGTLAFQQRLWARAAARRARLLERFRR